jgi:hypothetical protein
MGQEVIYIINIIDSFQQGAEAVSVMGIKNFLRDWLDSVSWSGIC